MKKQLKSFSYAIKGIVSAVISETHMRFHIVVAIYVIFFGAAFYKLTDTQWCIVMLTISGVFAAEIINTSIERLCDSVTTDYSKDIAFTKDTAAGAVLTAAVFAVAVAVFIFFKPYVLLSIFEYFISHITALAALIISVVISCVFVTVNPKKYLKQKSKSKK